MLSNSSNFTTESKKLRQTAVDSKLLPVGQSSPILPRPAGDLREIEASPPDSAEMLTEWGLWLAEVLAYAPWSPEANNFVDKAIANREGQGGAA